MNKKNGSILCFLVALVLVCVTSANAAFTGIYDVSLWTVDITTGSNGSLDISGAPASVTFTSANGGLDAGFPANVDFTITAVEAGPVSFHWEYTPDITGSDSDMFFFLINGGLETVSLGGLSGSQSGDFTRAILVGDVFGFRQATIDRDFGFAVTTVSMFSAPVPPGLPPVILPPPPPFVPVPEPATLGLMGIGLLGLIRGSFQRKK